jgi:hypothetical protein
MKNAQDNANLNRIEELLRDLLITSLGSVGVKSAEVRKIVGCGMDRVTRILKHIERGK